MRKNKYLLLIVRHAVAEDREKYSRLGKPDALRPLTSKGKKKFWQVCKRIKKILPKPQRILSSPFVRAADTAKILHKAFPDADVRFVDRLKATENPALFISELKKQNRIRRCIVVGHEPYLSKLINYLITGQERESGFKLRKGGCCLLEIPYQPRKGDGKLLWLLQPSLLRNI